MSDLSLIPLQDGYESQLSQDWDGATGTVYVLATPSYTPTTANTYIVVNPGKTNMQIAEITDYDSTAKTLTVSSISFEKGLGISSTAQSHSTGSKVIISDNYQFWEDIQTAINTKLDDTGGTMTGLLQFTGTTHAGIKLLSLTTAQRDALSASNGMIIYNSTTGELNQYIGGAWSAVASGSTQPTASTTVLGKIKTDVTPAGDPVALIQDNPKYDALAGTSGTPSTSNKYVTNDDTATAATASKVARRLAGGNITVVTESQGNNSTNAASTAYVDAGLAAIVTTVPEQEIPYLAAAVANSIQTCKFATSVDGSVAVIAFSNAGNTNCQMRRLIKDTLTGQYVITHSATFSSGAVQDIGICLTTSYLYVSYTDGVKKIDRFNIADLTSQTSITISGTNWTQGQASFSDGTDLYIYTATDQFNRYTISGTTATFASTITYTSAGAVINGGATCNGTNVWTISTTANSTVINKYAIAGGAIVSTATRLYYYDALQTASIKYPAPGIYKAGVLLVVYPFQTNDAAAQIGGKLKITAITQP